MFHGRSERDPTQRLTAARGKLGATFQQLGPRLPKTGKTTWSAAVPSAGAVLAAAQRLHLCRYWIGAHDDEQFARGHRSVPRSVGPEAGRLVQHHHAELCHGRADLEPGWWIGWSLWRLVSNNHLCGIRAKICFDKGEPADLPPNLRNPTQFGSPSEPLMTPQQPAEEISDLSIECDMQDSPMPWRREFALRQEAVLCQSVSK